MKRSTLLAAILGVGLSSIFMLPPFKVVESAMSLEIPKEIGDWTTTPVLPTDKEINSLASDTRFSKASCKIVRPGTWNSLYMRGIEDQAELSIVLSGQDLANSIHRPERCMGAQGHEIYLSEQSRIDCQTANGHEIVDAGKAGIALPKAGTLPTRKLISKRKEWIATSETEKTEVEFNYLTYYFFVGNEMITESHKARTLVDMRDRLAKGQAQKWAYILVTMRFRAGTEDPRFNWGSLPDLKTADSEVRSLLGEIAENNINWKQITTLN
ncbi:exosortase-associated EpsI family protein [Haloferula sp. BvORR071]|uniref:exosortase-associated EpsI family protein n=1 Tax=Haloferula sp. BvORR071 TaxID=1396141 RepID=UPI000556A686|nr:exosortase-associated EpsI family protein [Haloferula sp. BvORR071]